MSAEVPQIEASSGLRVLVKGTAKPLGFNFADSRLIAVAGATLSSATVTVVTAGYFTVGSATVSGSVATATFTASANGSSLVYCKGTFSDGSTDTIIAQVKVVDPADATTW